MYVHGQGDKVGSGRLHRKKELRIHGQYKYLFLCFISALGTKHVQTKSKMPFAHFSQKGVTKSYSTGIENLCLLFYSS